MGGLSPDGELRLLPKEKKRERSGWQATLCRFHQLAFEYNHTQQNRFYIGEVVTSGFHPAHFQFAHWRRFDNVRDKVCVTSNS
jgi:hypothetical protein